MKRPISSAGSNRTQEYSLEDSKGGLVINNETGFAEFSAASSDSFFADIDLGSHPRSKSVRGNRSELLTEGVSGVQMP